MKQKIKKSEKNLSLDLLRLYGFSRIAEKIELMWGSFELDSYFRSLIMLREERAFRKGFNKKAFSLILGLYLLHSRLFDFSDKEATVIDWRG